MLSSLLVSHFLKLDVSFDNIDLIIHIEALSPELVFFSLHCQILVVRVSVVFVDGGLTPLLFDHFAVPFLNRPNPLLNYLLAVHLLQLLSLRPCQQVLLG